MTKKEIALEIENKTYTICKTLKAINKLKSDVFNTNVSSGLSKDLKCETFDLVSEFDQVLNIIGSKNIDPNDPKLGHKWLIKNVKKETLEVMCGQFCTYIELLAGYQEKLNNLLVKFEEYQKEQEAKIPAHTFYFEHSCDTAKNKTPYVAKLFVDSDGRIQREFFDLDKEYGKNTVLVTGHFQADTGEIIEQREGGSWKNEYRYWYIVTSEGKLKKVADIDSAHDKNQVKKYLKDELTASELKEV